MNPHVRTENAKSASSKSWLVSMIWWLSTPGIIFLVLEGVALLTPHSEARGWGLLGVVLLLAPVILVVAHGGVFIVVTVGLLALRVVAQQETSRNTKVEVAIAFALCVLSAILVWFVGR